jgi:GAF domain-containing protein
LNLTKLEETEQPFTPSDRDLISVLAGQVAVAIENARLFQQQRAITEQLARANANLHALQQAATATTSRLSPQRVLQTILDGCAAVMENATIALGLLDPDHSHIEVHLHYGDTKTRDAATLVLSEEEVAALETIAGVKSVLTERLSALVQSHSRTTEIGVIPLEVRDQLLGAMAVGTTGDLTEAEISTLRPFADQAAVAIANARLFTQLQQAYEDLQETNRLKSESIHAVVHDLQTTLSAIRTYTDLLEEKIGAEEKKYLCKVQEAVAQLESHIADLIATEGRTGTDNGPTQPFSLQVESRS